MYCTTEKDPFNSSKHSRKSDGMVLFYTLKLDCTVFVITFLLFCCARAFTFSQLTNFRLFQTEWNDTNSTKYCENIYKHFLDGKFEEIDCLIDNEDVNVNTILEAFENILKLCSEDIKHTRRTLRKTNCKKWFDIECKHAKHKTIKSLRKFRARRSVENLNKYITDKKSYKNICRNKRLLYEKQCILRLENSIGYPKLFWDQIKNLTNIQPKSSNISIDEWYEHFKFLNFSENVTDDNPADNLENTDMGVDGLYYVDSLQDNIFNRPITDEEIIEVVKKLESKKSCSGTLVSQYFRFAMPTILPYLRKFLNRLFEKGEFPESWTRAIIVQYKKREI